MLSRRFAIERVECGRFDMAVTMPATSGTIAATPKPTSTMPVACRADLFIRSAASNPAPRPIATCDAATTPETGRFSLNFSKDSWDMGIEAKMRVWDFQSQMKRALGVDLGDVRVGLALSDDLGMLAHPLETVAVQGDSALRRVTAIVAEREIGAVVVGMPRNMNGTYGPAAEKARVFIDALKPLVACPVIAWDERLTTVAAQRALQEAGRNSREQRKIIDQVAAQLLLQSWLDAQA